MSYLKNKILSQKNQIFFYSYSQILFRSDQFLFEISHSVLFRNSKFHFADLNTKLKKSEYLRILVIPFNNPNIH